MEDVSNHGRRDKSRLYKDGRHWGTMMLIKPYAPVETSIYRVSEYNGNPQGRRFIASRNTMVIPKDVDLLRPFIPLKYFLL